MAGYIGRWDEWGVEVDWEPLTSADASVSWTETAALLSARGTILERHGGFPPQLREAVVDTVEALA